MEYVIDIPEDELNENADIIIFKNMMGQIQANLCTHPGVEILGILSPINKPTKEENA